MKIAISGTDSTGKTSLVKSISERYDIPIIPECAREIAVEMNIKNLRTMRAEQAFEFQNRVLDRKFELESKYKSFIADRSTVDNAAYYLRWCSREIDDGRNRHYIDRCISQLKTYNKIFVLPWNSIPLEKDGFRSTKLYHLYEIHCLIIGLLKDNDINYLILSKTDFEERVNFFARFFEK